MDDKFWTDMLGVLKDIGSYLEKQDATQERANIDDPQRLLKLRSLSRVEPCLLDLSLLIKLRKSMWLWTRPLTVMQEDFPATSKLC